MNLITLSGIDKETGAPATVVVEEGSEVEVFWAARIKPLPVEVADAAPAPAQAPAPAAAKRSRKK